MKFTIEVSGDELRSALLAVRGTVEHAAMRAKEIFGAPDFRRHLSTILMRDVDREYDDEEAEEAQVADAPTE